MDKIHEDGSKVISQMPQLNGILILNKPTGISSAKCLVSIKRMGQKKIGHAGTLDPLASGVLPVLLGSATKISGYLLAGGEKVYSGQILLGQTTDTWDSEGQVLSIEPWEHLREDEVKAAALEWQGQHEQIVPMYSAAKYKGQPLYKFARKGISVPEKKKIVNILHVEVISIELPKMRFRVRCSSGTYIRSLAHSLGMRLGTGAILTELIREYSYPFSLEKAQSPEFFVDNPEKIMDHLLAITDALPDWGRYTLLPDEEPSLFNGMAQLCDYSRLSNFVAADLSEGTKAFIIDKNGKVLAIVEAKSHGDAFYWHVLRGLW